MTHQQLGKDCAEGTGHNISPTLHAEKQFSHVVLVASHDGLFFFPVFDRLSSSAMVHSLFVMSLLLYTLLVFSHALN